MAVGPALFVLAMTAEHGSAGERVAAGAMLLLGGGLAAAGLWLRDGQRRGAVLAVALDGLRVVLLLLAFPRTGALDFTFAAGLWLRDGQRRGAVLAVALDGLRVVLLLLAFPRTGALDFAFAAGLLGGAIWLWPTLGPQPGVDPRRV